MQTSKVIYKFRLFKKNQLSFFFLTDQRILFVFPERKFFINQTILLFSLKGNQITHHPSNGQNQKRLKGN